MMTNPFVVQPLDRYQDLDRCQTTMNSIIDTVLKIGLIGRLISRLILFNDSPLNITLIALIMPLGD